MDKMGKNSISCFVSCLLNSATQTHIFHFQTRSYAAHKALRHYFNGIVDLADSVAESYQGRYGIITDYSMHNFCPIESSDVQDFVDYLYGLHEYVEKSCAELFTDSDIINIIDEIKSLIKSTLYKLRFLQ